MNLQKTMKMTWLKAMLIVSLVASFFLTGHAQTVATKSKQVVTSTNSESKKAQTNHALTKSGVEGIKKGETIDKRKSTKDGLPPKKIYTVLEIMPQFPGGESELLKYINVNLKYPLSALHNNIRGRVITRFVINELGKIENPEILKSIDPSLDKEALRLVTSLPDFTPGEFKGKKVAVWYTLPINFRPENLDNSSTININDLGGKKMVFLADGKEITYEELKVINPADMESIEILKDASALSEYGDKAKDGVFKIKLKKKIN